MIVFEAVGLNCFLYIGRKFLILLFGRFGRLVFKQLPNRRLVSGILGLGSNAQIQRARCRAGLW
ncbi:MAG: hypothetical protein RIS60_871 [Pseudomonadota bacterium]